MKRKRILITALIIVTSILAALGSILINVATSQGTPFGRLPLSSVWLLVGVVTLIGIIVSVILYYLQADRDKGISPTHHRRQQMLKKVKAIWIDGVLQQSLNGAALIALGLQEQPEAVALPSHLVFFSQGRASRLLPPNTHIIEVYDEAGGELLILGEPGSGKTTLLLELTRELLNRTQNDEHHPIPIVLNLTSWTLHQYSLVRWLIEELSQTYHVSRSLAQEWIDMDQIIPLLDGLDEVSPQHRGDCIDAIATYHQEHGLTPIVICCRSTEYRAQQKRLPLRSAVELQPLTLEQIDSYLLSGGEQLTAVRLALYDDPYLCQLIATPLMLSVLTLAYHRMSIDDLVRMQSPAARRHHLFEIYVQRMLEYRGNRTRYKPQKTMSRLTWLARQMAQHSQTEFHIARIQPYWLLGTPYYQSFLRLMESYQANLLFGLVIGPLVGYIIGSGFGWIAGFITALIIGIGIELLMAIAAFNLNEPRIKLVLTLASEMILGLVIMVILADYFSWQIGAPIGLSTAVILGGLTIISGLQLRVMKMSFLLGIAIGWLLGLGIGLTCGFLLGEALLALLRTPWWLATWFLKGILLALFLGLIADVLVEGLTRQKAWWGIIGSIFLCGFLFLAFSVTISASHLTLIWISIYALCGIGLVVGAVLAMRCSTPIKAAITGLLFRKNGGPSRVILRLFLWYVGYLPWNYVRFLNYAVEHILLRKVGRSYIFIHQLLLDYFATRDDL